MNVICFRSGEGDPFHPFSIFDYSQPPLRIEKGIFFFILRFSFPCLEHVERWKYKFREVRSEVCIYKIDRRMFLEWIFFRSRRQIKLRRFFERIFQLLTNFLFEKKLAEYKREEMNEILQIFYIDHILLHFNFVKFPAEIVYFCIFIREYLIWHMNVKIQRGGILHVMSNNWMVYGWNFCIFISVIYWTLRLQTKCSISFHVYVVFF